MEINWLYPISREKTWIGTENLTRSENNIKRVFAIRYDLFDDSPWLYLHFFLKGAEEVEVKINKEHGSILTGYEINNK